MNAVQQLEKLSILLETLLKEGHGEIQYRIVVKNSKVEYVQLTKVNTYRAANDIIEK